MPSSSTSCSLSSCSSTYHHHHHHLHQHSHSDDYFAYEPVGYNSHFSTETPLSSPGFASNNDPTLPDPYNPLLAHRQQVQSPLLSTSPRMAANLLQLQTGAAYSSNNSNTSASRPSIRPTQNLLNLDSSSDGSDSSAVNSRASSEEYARCSRCQRTPSIDVRTGQWNMVPYGLNLWYCSRCATLVGLPKR